MHKTSLGADEHVASAVCYLFGWITGLIFIFAETENRTIRFHAWQSFFVFVCLQVLIGLCLVIPFIGWFFLLPMVSLGYLVLWLFLIVAAYQGKKIVLPFFGPIAERYALPRPEGE